MDGRRAHAELDRQTVAANEDSADGRVYCTGAARRRRLPAPCLLALCRPDSQRAISNGNNAPGWRMALTLRQSRTTGPPATGWTALTPDDGGPMET